MSLWGSRFNSSPDNSLLALSRSVHFDWRLAPYEIEVNLAHLKNLENQSVIGSEDVAKIRQALIELAKEIGSGKFIYNSQDEDVHSAIERGLIEKCGQIGGAIRAGRSRNDLVVTDFKLFLIDHLLEIALHIISLIKAINAKAEQNLETVAPGFTHTQHAQPISFAQELSKHSQSLLRDVDRIFDWLDRNSKSAFGAGALAGSSLVPQPEKIAKELGFSSVMENSIDAVSDRDFAAEALFVLAMLGVHLSKIGEEFILWSSSEFKWVELSDKYTTGSSIMPQKKNADIAELARGKAGRLIGNLAGLLATLKGLPLAYNRDLQEDKEPFFDSLDQVNRGLVAVAEMIAAATFNVQAMREAADSPAAVATDLAEWLVARGMPFRQAHAKVGDLVARSIANATPLVDLVQKDEQLGADAAALFAPGVAVRRRSSHGAAGPDAARAQHDELRRVVDALQSRLP